MSSRHSSRQSNRRDLIAQEAARLMAESGIRDFQLAKRKALERLRLGDVRELPRNEEIEHALAEYQRIFRAHSQPQHLGELRRVAIEAMRFLAPFKPRLVGSVLSGTADEHSDVCLHVFADAPEDVALFLMERGVPHRACDHRVRLSPDQTERLPGFRFLAGEETVELVVFCERTRRRTPLSPVDGKPMQRASLAAVEALGAAED